METYLNSDTLIGRFSIIAVFLIFIVLPVSTGCSGKQDLEMKPVASEAESPAYEINKSQQPVSIDFREIQERGTLKVIMKYQPASFFLYRGLDRGLEYELINKFARQHDLRLEIVLLQPGEDPFELLNTGKGDILAARLIKSYSAGEKIAFTKPYNRVNQHIVLPDSRAFKVYDGEHDRYPSITVPANSLLHLSMAEINLNDNKRLDIKTVPSNLEPEDLIAGVADGRYKATVADENQFDAIASYIAGVKKGPVIAADREVVLGVRKNSHELQARLDNFIYGHYKYDIESNREWRSTFLSILQQRYFGNYYNIDKFRYQIQSVLYHGSLTEYDDLVRPIADSAGVDWKLVLAVMAKESSFRPEARSFAGAVGLMQILPRFSRISDENLLMDPEINVREGVRYLQKHLRHYAYIDSTNRLALTLAAYNAGMGHVADARRIAIDRNRNPNEWEPVADALLRLMESRYYRNARYGYCRGTETVDYVTKVMNRYRIYQEVHALAETVNKDNGRGDQILVLGMIQGPYHP